MPSPKFCQGLTTLIVKNIFLHVPVEQVRFHFTGPVNSIPVLIFFFCPASSSTHFTFSNISFLQSVPFHGRFGSPALSKRGHLYPSRLFQGFIANLGDGYSLPLTHSSAVSLKKFIVLIVWVILLSSSLSTPSVLWNLTANISADHV